MRNLFLLGAILMSVGNANATVLEAVQNRDVAALEQAGWVQAKAARLLGMTPRQIAYRIQTLNIEVKQF